MLGRARKFLFMLMTVAVTFSFWAIASTRDAHACPHHEMAQASSESGPVAQTAAPQSNNSTISDDVLTITQATKPMRLMSCPGRKGGFGSTVLCCHHVEVFPAIESRQTSISAISLGWKAKPDVSIAALALIIQPAVTSSDPPTPSIDAHPPTLSSILAQTQRLRL